MACFIPVPLIMLRRRACIWVITRWIVDVLQTHFLTCHLKLAHVSKLGIIQKPVGQYGLIMHSKLVVGRVSYDRFNGSVAGAFNNAFQHSCQPCFLSQIQWLNYSHFFKQHFVYILQSVYGKGEGSVLVCIFRKRKPTHCVCSWIIQELLPCLSQAVAFSNCFVSVAYRYFYTSLKDAEKRKLA